jgi:7-keto-8-aminopelargonate synthetase-like enzyme
MARLIELKDKRWIRSALDTDEMLERKHDRLLNEYLKRSKLATEQDLKGFVYMHPLYDSFAYYVVTNHNPLKVAWINYYKGHRVRKEIINDLTIDDLVSIMRIEKRLDQTKKEMDKLLESLALSY